MTNRRSFIRRTAAALGSLALHQNFSEAFPMTRPSPVFTSREDLSDDDFWRQIRTAFSASPNLINLNNGGVSPTPRATLDALDYYNRMCSEAPSYYMWRVLNEDREPLRYNLAALAGVDPEEVAINRNSTEALNTLIFGLNLKRGDEVVLSKYDYPHMVNAWKQREMREGIRLVWVDLMLPSEDEKYLVEAYASKFSERTKVVHLTHVINWNGQIMPVRKIADRAHAAGIEVLVDAAHSFALLDYKIPDLGCDYWGTSLHKWMCAPYGSGMMWIRKDKISSVWPLLSHDKPDSDNIKKFESLGTRSFPTEMAIGYSLDLHNYIGTARKQQRLHFLKNYWMERVRELSKIRLYTSMDPRWGCAIGNVGIEGKASEKFAGALFTDWKIHVTTIVWEQVDGIRITPNVYTTTDELDKLVKAIREIAA
ncbi:MAG: aminotransferase class V-fold PLP-dependent enzyme [Saprospiraceae bacterium]|nr:aminotransferase class V-fold PLP-dependent enzyme [Saprospiraceae bacterium]MCB9354806.1 aminotransferase class V-fold PLP-dependent enzyme [Lewinellaceae bacterium]